MILAQVTAPDLTAWLIGTPVTVLAFGIIAFVRGWIIPGHAYNRVVAKLDAKEAELHDQYLATMDKVIPTLLQAQSALAEIARERSR